MKKWQTGATLLLGSIVVCSILFGRKPQEVSATGQTFGLASVARPASQRLAPTDEPHSAMEDPEACGQGYQLLQRDHCVPVQTGGQPYSPEQVEKLTDLAFSPLVARGNLFVPQPLTLDEARTRSALLERIRQLASLIDQRKASEQEVTEYFTFRERLASHRMQILMHLHWQGGGEINLRDPDLRRDQITNPELLELHAKLTAEAHQDYLQRMQVRRSHGLPAEEKIDWPGINL